MTSDDSPHRITPDLLAALLVEGHVDDLTVWRGSGVDHDLGAVMVYDSEFGQTQLPIVWNGEVLFGGEMVEAERLSPSDNGKITYLDFTSLGWTKERAQAAAIGQATRHKQAFWDESTLLDTLVAIREHDKALTLAAGWSDDALNDLVEDSQTPIFDAEPERTLCGECGQPIPKGG